LADPKVQRRVNDFGRGIPPRNQQTPHSARRKKAEIQRWQTESFCLILRKSGWQGMNSL